MKVFVTGAAGFIGSVVTQRLIQEGYEVLGFDNLSKGHTKAIEPGAQFVEGDLRDAALIDKTLKDYRPEAVLHLAAEALIDESVKDPGLFFTVNASAGIPLLDSMRAIGCSRMIFSSTAATYGEPQYVPIDEEHPKEPVNSYGESKIQFERIMYWYRRSFGLNHVSFRYFNACGASDKYGEARKKETHIIPLLFEVALGHRKEFKLFGTDYDTPDGTCVRDYVHVIDIANAHILGLKKVDEIGERAYNIGSGNGNTNLEVIEAVREVTGHEIPFIEDERRPGDPARLVASSDRIKAELGWQPEFADIKEMVRSAWTWRQKHPNGYDS
jgi:UDP-glucose 4-epimerase